MSEPWLVCFCIKKVHDMIQSIKRFFKSKCRRGEGEPALPVMRESHLWPTAESQRHRWLGKLPPAGQALLGRQVQAQLSSDQIPPQPCPVSRRGQCSHPVTGLANIGDSLREHPNIGKWWRLQCWHTMFQSETAEVWYVSIFQSSTYLP